MNPLSPPPPPPPPPPPKKPKPISTNDKQPKQNKTNNNNKNKKITIHQTTQQQAKQTSLVLIKSVRSWCDESSVRSFIVDPLSYFSFQPVLHDWGNKGRGMCYPVCGMMYIKEPLLLIGKSSPYGGSGFPLSLSKWSFTICPTPYNRK